MTERRKKVIALLSTVFLVCTCCGGFTLWTGTFIRSAVITDAERVQTVGQEIAAYAVPDGYQEFIGFQFLGNKSVAIVNDGEPPEVIILLMQVPTGQGIDDAQFETQMRTVMEQFNFQPIDFKLDETETRQIAGRDVEVTYNSGSDNAGLAFRQMSLFFSTRKGKAFILAQGPESAWDQTKINQLLDSIE
ncbi:MAG: hypothetical protein AAF629_01170 [Chloroflexota bacterium]